MLVCGNCCVLDVCGDHFSAFSGLLFTLFAFGLLRGLLVIWFVLVG